MDFSITCHGSICLVQPTTPEGSQWIEDNTDPDNRSFLGNSLAVDSRYLEGLADGFSQDGLTANYGAL